MKYLQSYLVTAGVLSIYKLITYHPIRHKTYKEQMWDQTNLIFETFTYQKI